MHHLPATLFQSLSDKPAVAFPGELLGTAEDAPMPPRTLLNLDYRPTKSIGIHILLIAARTKSTQSITHPDILNAPLSAIPLETVTDEMPESASRKSPHIKQHRNPILHENLTEIRNAPVAGSQGKYLFHYNRPEGNRAFQLSSHRKRNHGN
jgi:hypothetical protein